MSEDLRRDHDWCDPCEKDKEDNNNQDVKVKVDCGNCDSKKSFNKCCCDLEVYRKIFKFLQREEAFVIVTTNLGIALGFVYDVTEDMVSIALDETPYAFFPLCDIVEIYILAIGPGVNQNSNNMQNEIYKCVSSDSKKDCCCNDGIAETIRNILKYNEDPTIILTLEYYVGDLDLQVREYERDEILKVTDDFILTQVGPFYVITSTCAIKALYYFNEDNEVPFISNLQQGSTVEIPEVIRPLYDLYKQKIGLTKNTSSQK